MSHNSHTNLDHFQFRDYSCNLGRWLSPDPAGLAAASLADPQSFNRYSYVENQPVNFADNSGLLLTLGEEQGWCDVDGTCNFTFGWANGASNFDMTPGGDGCGSVSSLGQGSCQLPPGLWPNDQPIMQSGVLIDFSGNLYGNMPGTNISLSSVPLPWQINNNQECGDFAPCNNFTLPKVLPPTLFQLLLPGMNYCGPGDSGGKPTNALDKLCEEHDACYNAAGASWLSVLDKSKAVQACDAILCKNLPNVVPTNSNESGNIFWVGLAFLCIP